MYICNCNGLTDRQIDAACKDGAETWPEVYAYHGCAPKCGKCVPQVAQRLNGDDASSAAFFGEPAFSEA